jgi:hypothetical protein
VKRSLTFDNFSFLSNLGENVWNGTENSEMVDRFSRSNASKYITLSILFTIYQEALQTMNNVDKY